MTNASLPLTSSTPAPGAEDSFGCFIPPGGEELIRRDLHGPDHLEAIARILAEASVLAPAEHRGRPLLRHFYHTGQQLKQAYQQIRQAASRQEMIGPETEWLLDNFYIIEESLRETRHDLPQGYYTKLPKLALGPLAGYPRVYALSLSLIAHTDSGLDEDNILRFVEAYQTVTPLTIGELWAIPIMLRLALVENLRRLAHHILRAWQDRQEATAFLRQVQHLIEQHDRLSSRRLTEEEIGALFYMAPDVCPRDPFVLHLHDLLRDHDLLGKPGIDWLERHLGRHGSDTDQVFQRETQRQARNQVCVGNCVTSLRVLSALDWNVFFEKVSLVDHVLREDPAGIYARQDFSSRDRYRQAIEKLARGSHVLEADVARRAVALARSQHNAGNTVVAAAGAPQLPPALAVPDTHIGYYLLGKGRRQLADAIAFRPPWGERLLHAVLKHAHLVYFGGILLFLALFLGLLLRLAAHWSAGVPVLVALGLVALLPASELAVGLVNYLVTVFLPPRVLPKLDFKDGIPATFATCVVMPTMLTHPDSASQLVDRLEVHYLGNPDPHLCWALLTDFADAPAEHMPTDEAYVQAALEGIRKLNREYCGDGTERFFLFHRGRQWNASQGCWMGWERKRGKLHEFNRLLRGDSGTSISVRSGALPFPIRFVITLDMDTQVPREAAMRLVGTLAHPLNQPRFDPAAGRVVEGYGILQPRVNITMQAAERSLFARIYATSAGIDPYTTAVSDVYQDLFGAGSYTGKGIYDVDAFEAAVGQRFADNTVLSHDLIEGNFARCGLVTDIQLLDDFPARYHVFARREHRWARGDWQILPWLFGRAARESEIPAEPAPSGREGEAPAKPAPSGSAEASPSRAATRGNPLPLLERWKIFDNLRRTLVPPSLLLLLLLGWTLLPGPAWLWTLVALLVPAWPFVLLIVDRARALVHGQPFLSAMRAWQTDVTSTLLQSLLAIVLLVDLARLMVDAAVRTLWRLLVSRRHLLEWETAASTEKRLGCGFAHYSTTMAPAVFLGCVLGLIVGLLRPTALLAAAPLLLAWLAAPLVAFWVSRPRVQRQEVLTAAERQQLRLVARKIWAFFETYVGDTDHFLPPDNYQEDPEGKVAHRTSPTNMGLLLLSTLAARDFGYISLGQLIGRLEKTFDTLDRLERYEGHFHNWYDTLTLRSLQPSYVSTVDSGNLLGCLLTLRQGLLDIREASTSGAEVGAGLVDTFQLASLSLKRLTAARKNEAVTDFQLLDESMHALERLLLDKAPSLPGEAGARWLSRLAEQGTAMLTQARKLAALLREPPEELLRWAQAFVVQVQAQREELSRPAALPDLLERCDRLAARAGRLAADMDFSVLYNQPRHLFAIGYNLALGRMDNAHYDLLASEAALTSFLAVARGEAPRRHWFQLGRPLTRVSGQVALLSWGGTMFEYLMPRLLLRVLPDTLLAESIHAAVERQIEYGRERRVPWGVSESGYSTLDSGLDYQYQSFGVPGLGLRRGLGQDLVVAPYATLLALPVRPHAAVVNLRRLTEEQAEGPFGYYEAIDYTPSRLPPHRRSVVVRSYMAHHQGMSFIALANQLLNEPMPRRFHDLAAVRATELLLQERMPRAAPILDVADSEAPATPVPQEVAAP